MDHNPSEKMENKVIESILQAVKKLQQDQKNMMAKFTKLTEVCRNKLNKIEHEKVENNKALERKFETMQKDSEVLKKEQEAFEARFETIDKNIEDLKKEEVKLLDDVSNLESEREKVSNHINLIDEALEEIKEQNTKHIHVNTNENKIDDNESRKQCKYDRKGFCRQAENCLFLHADTTCEIYLETGVCWKSNCHQRHPKTCRYGSRCYRGESCRYLHQDSTCGKCQQFSHILYYCEFCKQSFCSSCTVKQAHLGNIYENPNSEDPKCENIHQ